ncbi:MAG: ribonuclease H-like domain-containing protein [Patescibacteria group bacterium]
MSKLVFDIETIGEDFDLIDETTQEILTKYDDDIEKVKNGLGFSPLTGQIVCIGVLDVEKNRGALYYQAPDDDSSFAKASEDEASNFKFIVASEKEMLEKFWQGITAYDQVVSFNGRAFDAPFLAIRSAIHSVRPSKNLIPYRYATDTNHIDLYDQLTFYGSSRSKGNLHMFCRAFGIKSPKADGVTGDDVTRLFKEKKYLDIARYNVGDLKATAELYKYWNEFIRF